MRPDTLGKMMGPERFQQMRETRGMENDGLILPDARRRDLRAARQAASVDLDARDRYPVLLRPPLVEPLNVALANAMGGGLQ